MPDRVVLLSIPGLRGDDLAAMPHLRALVERGDRASLVPSFPAVTCPVQANMTTGCTPREHGVVANGFYWREKHEVEMWTAWNDVIQAPQIWDLIKQHDPELTKASGGYEYGHVAIVESVDRDQVVVSQANWGTTYKMTLTRDRLSSKWIIPY